MKLDSGLFRAYIVIPSIRRTGAKNRNDAGRVGLQGSEMIVVYRLSSGPFLGVLFIPPALPVVVDLLPWISSYFASHIFAVEGTNDIAIFQ